jgi:hypothetical protein
MEKPNYPGVDYSGHGIAGNNPNTLPRQDWQQAMDLLKECERLAGELAARTREQEASENVEPLSSQLTEGLSRLRDLLGES